MVSTLDPSHFVMLIGQAVIQWTPVTFYIAAGILHMITILLVYGILHVDPEYSTWVGALLAALVMNVAAYYLRDTGLLGVIGVAALSLVLLVAVSGGDMVKSLIATGACIAVWGGLAMVVVPRTPLTIDQIAGLPRVVMSGGLKAEPITNDEANELFKSKKVRIKNGKLQENED